MRRGLVAATVTLAAAALFAGQASGALRAVRVAGGFSSPVHVSAPRSEPNRLYVVEQGGLVKVIVNGRVRATPFLDLRSAVSSGGERGLLSMVFHPRYPTVRRVYVNFTNRRGDTRVVEYRVNGTRTRAVRSTGRRLLALAQPYSNHNGGGLAFGRDGFLYVPTGDGGAGGDPQNRAQNRRSRLGKLLRINTRTRAVRIVALGFRNPWRVSVDRATGRFWLGDVGQNAIEEIDVWRPGARGLENYGWRRFEGTTVYDGGTGLAGGTRYVRPVYQYSHAGGACSVTGGHVYRGRAVGAARGRYFFGDYCTGRVSSFVLRNGRAARVRHHFQIGGALSSFGEGATGELYMVSHGGSIYRLAG